MVYTGQRGYHPLLAPAGAGTGDVLIRLRRPTVRGAAHFLRETGGTGALRRGQGTTHGARRQRLLCPRPGRGLPRGCPLLHHHPPAPRLRNISEAIPEEDWTPIPYWMDGAVAETTYTPFRRADVSAARGPGPTSRFGAPPTSCVRQVRVGRVRYGGARGHLALGARIDSNW